MNPEDRVWKGMSVKDVEDVDALLCLINDTVDKGFGRAKGKDNSKLRGGLQQYRRHGGHQRGIILALAVLTDATQTCWGCCGRGQGIVESDKFTRAGSMSWSLHCFGRSVAGKTLGIIGAGRIGRAVAKRSIGFDMKVLYHNRKGTRTWKRVKGGGWTRKPFLESTLSRCMCRLPTTRI